jgi:hypothetical protein
MNAITTIDRTLEAEQIRQGAARSVVRWETAGNVLLMLVSAPPPDYGGASAFGTVQCTEPVINGECQGSVLAR